MRRKNFKKILLGRHSIIFDETSRLGEVFANVIRFTDSEWNGQQKLIRLQMLCKSLCGDEIACELINTLSYEYGKSKQLVASANNVAIRTLKFKY